MTRTADPTANATTTTDTTTTTTTATTTTPTTTSPESTPLSPKDRASIQYLVEWKCARDQWKFHKNRQQHLLQHLIFDGQKVDFRTIMNNDVISLNLTMIMMMMMMMM